MTRSTRIVAALLVALLVPAASAGAAKRKVPQSFYGVNYSGNVELLSPVAQARLWNKLASGGVESARVLFNWDLAERTPGTYKWSRIDSLVTNAVRRGMTVLPTVEYAPAWAKQYPDAVSSPPASNGPYTAFLRAAIARYGPNGEFWGTAGKNLPYRPIRQWEVWNEPEIGFHWYRGPKKRPWAKQDAQRYVSLLRASYKVVHAADPGAKVVQAPFSIDSWKSLKKLYDWTDVEGQFDVATVQAYSGTVDYIPTILRNYRNVLNAHGAGSVPLYVTEITWPAAKGIAHPSYTTGYMSGFLVKQPEAAKRLTAAYALLGGKSLRDELKLQRVYWYIGVSSYQSANEFEYSGLLNYQNNKVLTYPVFGAYQQSAQGAEGCAKYSVGVCK